MTTNQDTATGVASNTDRLLAGGSLAASVLMLLTLWISGVFSLRDRLARLEGLFEGHMERPCPSSAVASKPEQLAKVILASPPEPK
ncbi:hypothetical protein [Candidatus Palauibacter sp.]|uniref:hypothetical protein n=1 Tax=Candidatus Palauibacter sp. TaxID=3101350 RepID=UPI003B5C2398